MWQWFIVCVNTCVVVVCVRCISVWFVVCANTCVVVVACHVCEWLVCSVCVDTFRGSSSGVCARR